MFSVKVLPTLRQQYYTRGSDAAFKRCCIAFARKVGLPRELWPMVTVPCFMSLDNDTRHTWLRQVIALPRLPADVLDRHDREFLLAQLEQFGLRARELPVSLDGDHVDAFDLMCDEDRRRAAAQPKLHKQYDEAIERYVEKYSVHPLWLGRWYRSLTDDRYLVMIPMQLMPLSPVSPDIHSPVEHMVGTLKTGLYELIFEFAGQFDFSHLKRGATYQKMIDTVVREHGNGKEAKQHIRRSVQKQPQICKVLAADAGTPVTVQLRVGDSERHTDHVVSGTGGQWAKHYKLS